jgi:large subunit ribosomal protein L3
MIDMLLGRKLAMTQIWDADGNVHPVTVLHVGPCPVVQVKQQDGKDHYDAVQLAFEETPARNAGKGDPRANKPMLGVFKKASLIPHRYLREVRLSSGQKAPEVGTVLKVDQVFEGVKSVDVIGTSKGRGFSGVMKRHGFSGGFKSHGSKNMREPGATSSNQTPSRQLKGKRLPGQFGNKRATARNLDVVKIEGEQNLLYVKGAVPGPKGGFVLVRKHGKGGN